jgi:hypothetical protein
MYAPIQQLGSLQQAVELVEQSDFYTLFPEEMNAHERQLLLAAPAAAARCLHNSSAWSAHPRAEIELLLLNPSPLDAVDEGRSWGLLSLLLGLSPLTPIQLTLVGERIELASSSANSSELRSIRVTQYHQPPIRFLLEHPEYRADAAFLLHPASNISPAGVQTLRELQQREILLFGTSFSRQEGAQLGQELKRRGIARHAWQQENPCALALQQFTHSSAIWGHTLWQIDPVPLQHSADQRIGDLTRQTVLNIIEGGELVSAQYLQDLQSEQSALTTLLNLLNLLEPQSRSELCAHLFWNLFLQIRQGDPLQQRNELLQLMANLGWLGAAEANSPTAAAVEPQRTAEDGTAELHAP